MTNIIWIVLVYSAFQVCFFTPSPQQTMEVILWWIFLYEYNTWSYLNPKKISIFFTFFWITDFSRCIGSASTNVHQCILGLAYMYSQCRTSLVKSTTYKIIFTRHKTGIVKSRKNQKNKMHPRLLCAREKSWKEPANVVWKKEHAWFEYFLANEYTHYALFASSVLLCIWGDRRVILNPENPHFLFIKPVQRYPTNHLILSRLQTLHHTIVVY
jgi:predicted transcriptional regulator with HTH domain